MKKSRILPLALVATVLVASYILILTKRPPPEAVNPYEDVGRAHTDGLRALMQKVQPEKGEPKETMKIRVDSALKDWLVGYFEGKDIQDRQKQQAVRLASDQLSFIIRPTADDRQLGTDAAKEYKELIEAASTATSEDAFVKNVQSIELRVLSKKDEKKFQPVLIGAAIARNSAQFWATEYPKKPVWGERDYKWGKTAAQDIAGAVFCGIFGGVPGAVGGGVAASAADAIDQLWPE